MKVFNTIKASPWRTAILGLVLTGALASSASAAISQLTIDPTAQLSPGRLTATLTGTVTCDAGTLFLEGQIVQSNHASGFGSTQVVCNGTAQAYKIDVRSSSFFGPAGVFKAGKASAQVSTFICDDFSCTPRSTDAIIRLTK